MTTTELAGATRPCPDCVGCLQDHQQNAMYAVPGTCACKPCEGTGRVYIFPDMVREPCSGCHGCGEAYFEEGPSCQGRDWMPSEDGWVWLALAHDIRISQFITFEPGEGGIRWAADIALHGQERLSIAVDKTPKAAVLKALKRAVEAIPGYEKGRS